MKLTSKFLLIFMFTLFATLESSNNIHKMFSQLNTGEINKDDIMKYYKTSYDPMLELHNNFFDGCLDHLVNQELNNNKSFFMKMVEKVKDLFSQGANYEPLIIKDLGISIKCDNYVNQIISDNYIAKKKVELAKVKSNLVSINQGNARRPMGRAQSEQITQVKSEAKTPLGSTSTRITGKDGKTMTKEHLAGLEEDFPGINAKINKLTDSSEDALVNIIKDKNVSTTTKVTGGSASNMNIGGTTTSKTTTITTGGTTTKVINGGSLSTTGTSGTPDAQFEFNGSTKYSGSTLSGAGAKYNIFSDRRIVKEGDKSYVMIGGVKHLIDNDGWIHGLNIDSSDKNINYNIAYENYFDTSCESMLEFMKNKYKALLADFNMNKDYVHNLQIDNRRSILKLEVQNKSITELSLKYNSCEQRFQNEKVKKSTLYHNIKDIKSIKVNQKIKEMDAQIINLNTQITTYKTEIHNLKIIINTCKKDGEAGKKLCQDETKKKCDTQITDINNTCTKEKNLLLIDITRINKELLKIRIDYTNCLNRDKQCSTDILNVQLIKCKLDLSSITTKYQQLTVTIQNYVIEIQKLKVKITSLTDLSTTWEHKDKTCQAKLLLLLSFQKKYNDCETKIITINNTIKIKEDKWTIEKQTCDKNKIDWENDSKGLIKCNYDFEQYKVSILIKQSSEIQLLNEKCNNEKKDLTVQIDTEKKEVISWKGKYEQCDQNKQTCDGSLKTCNDSLITKITEITKTCDKDKEELNGLYEVNIQKLKIEITTCTDNAKTEKITLTTEYEKRINDINIQLTSVTNKLDACNTTKLSDDSRISTLTQSNSKCEVDLKTCKSDYDKITSQLKVITDKTVIDCTTITSSLTIKLSGCETKNLGYEKNITDLNSKISTLEITVNQLNKKIQINIDNCSTDCRKDRNKDIADEKAKCTNQITLINTEVTKINNLYITINAKYEQCQKTKNEMEENIKIKITLKQCEMDRDDYKKKLGDCEINKSSLETTIITLKKDKTLIQNNYDQCVKDRDSSEIKIALQFCNKDKAAKQKLIESLILQIQQSFANFNLVISKLQLSYDSKIQKLQEIIASTTSDKSKIKITIEYKITRKEELITDRDANDKNLKEYQLRIAQLLLQRKALMDKLDTIDSNNISIISEIKTQMTTIQINIDNFYTNIAKLDILIRQNISEIAALEAEIAIYKSNEEYYLDIISQYQTLLINMDAYILELKKIAEQDKIQNTDGTTFNLTVYINQIDSQNKDIIFTLKNQIEAFNVNIKELQRQYQVEYKKFRTEITKGVESCNIKVNILLQEKNELEESCEKKIKKRVEECEKSNATIILNLKAKWRQDLIEIKRKCNDNPSINQQTDVTYNFEMYKKHCIILIERNTENDCKLIDDIRSVYNEKCIMTALPTSTKDLTTFASSDFNDTKNQLMMNRLDTKK